MPDVKKILIAVSNSINNDLVYFSKTLKTSKSELVRAALEDYLKKLKRVEIEEKLKQGYAQMADINSTLAEMYFDAEENDFKGYEEKLAESEKCEC